MKAVFYTFLPLVIFVFVTTGLFVYLKDDGQPIVKENRHIRKVPIKKTHIKDLFEKSSPPKHDVEEDFESSKRYELKKESDYIPEIPSNRPEVKNVRWSKHHDFERVVFDIDTVGNYVGICEIEPDAPKTTYIRGELKGYGYFTTYIPNFLNSRFIKEFHVDKSYDGNYIFTIKFYKEVSFKAFSLRNPARIVIDLY